MSTDIETAIIGAGVVGLAIARALARQGHEVMVLERHDRIGAETSSRNSEVIHAGLYYPRGSLKAQLCVEGRAMLYAFAAESGIPHERVGKLIVATDDREASKLSGIVASARANGVDDVRELTASEARSLEPELHCVAAALSHSTGIIDSHALMLALEGNLASHNGSVVLETSVTGLTRAPDGTFVIETESSGMHSYLTARHLVIAAGLFASRLGRMLPYREGYRVPETIFAKGHYFTLAGRAPFRRLVYPVPFDGSLGIHFTLDTSHAGRFGPDITWADAPSAGEPDYTFEDQDGARRHAFAQSIRRYWPALPDDALQPGYTGVRPKISRRTEPAADFAIHGEERHGVPRLVALYGIESPGLTSSLAIGSYVARLLMSGRA